MINMQTIRQKYPQYSDLSDDALTTALHTKYYSDMPLGEFKQKIGTAPAPSLPSQIIGGINTLGKRVAKGIARPAISAADLINRAILNEPSIMGLPTARDLPQQIRQKFLGQIQQPTPSKGFVGQAEEAIGGAIPYALTGPAGEAAKGAELLAPELSKGLAQIGIGGTVGALQQPQSPVAGAIMGGAAPLVPGTISQAAKLPGAFIKKLTRQFPKKIAGRILNDLGQGRTLEGNAQSLAEDVRDSYENKGAQVAMKYGDALGDIKNKNIYAAFAKKQSISDKFRNSLMKAFPNMAEDRVSELVGQKSTQSTLPKNYLKNYPKLLNKYPLGLKTLHDNFNASPTFDNAHMLQSDLGKEVVDLRKFPSTYADRSLAKSFEGAKNVLQNHISNGLKFLDKTGDLTKKYKDASNFYRDEYMPYRKSTQIRDLATGKKTNPRNLTTIFKNPEADTIKVLGDLPQSSKDKIIYNELGKTKKNLTGENLLKAYTALDNKGIGSYVSNNLSDQMNILKHRLGMKPILSTAGKYIGRGALLGLTYKLAKEL